MFYGWKLLVGISLIFFLAVGLTFSGVGVLLPSMVAEFGWSRTQMGFGYALIALVFGFSGPVVAYVIDRIGVRKTMFYGGFINALGAITTYYTNSLWQFYLGAGLFMGLGMAMQTVIPGNQLIANWFYRKRSLALGIFLGLGGLGSMCAIPVSIYIDATGNWRHIWAVMGMCSLLASAIAYFLVKEKPSEVGQFSDGHTSEPEEVTTTTENKTQVFRSFESWRAIDAVKTSSFWFIVLGGSAAVMGTTMVTSQMVLHLTSVGITPVLAGTALGLQGTVGAGGRLMGGILGDKIDPRRLLTVGLAGQFVGIYFLKNAVDPLYVYLFVVIFGLGYGISAVSSTTLVVNFFGAMHNARLMAIRGIVVTIVGGIGPVGAGYLADVYGNYSLAFSIYMGVALFAALAVVMMPNPRPYRKNSHTSIKQEANHP